MVINKVIVCPICNKRTYLRIQNSGFLNEYPIRINCYNCRALLNGIFLMNIKDIKGKLIMYNANIEECDVDADAYSCTNVDYVAEVSGELPCDFVKEYEGVIPESPYMRIACSIRNYDSFMKRLELFNVYMGEWKKRKSTAFQLLDDGSVDYISKAVNNKMGEYPYECNHYLKAIHCLQEVVLDETKYLFKNNSQDNYVKNVINELSQIDNETIHDFSIKMGGIQNLLLSYRKTISVFSRFMDIYQNLLPAETYMNYLNAQAETCCISTCTFSDIKSFYQDSYEALLSLLYIPVCLDNIIYRSDYQQFSEKYNDVKAFEKTRNLDSYRKIDNGTRLNKLNNKEKFQALIGFPADRFLRNGIGHNNFKYDSITQLVTAYDMKNPNEIKYASFLIHVAMECLKLAKCAVILSEIILYFMRNEFRYDGIHSIIHPRFYVGAEPNDKCPCGSGVKYKKCCQREVETVIRAKNSDM